MEADKLRTLDISRGGSHELQVHSVGTKSPLLLFFFFVLEHFLFLFFFFKPLIISAQVDFVGVKQI